MKIKEVFNVVIDLKTFIRLNYSEEKFDLIEDIKIKHFKKLKIYLQNTINILILLVDFVFILHIKEIISKYFKNKNLIIKPASNELFIITFRNMLNSEKTNSCILEDNIFGYSNININELVNINNFIIYYYEIKKKFRC